MRSTILAALNVHQLSLAPRPQPGLSDLPACTLTTTHNSCPANSCPATPAGPLPLDLLTSSCQAADEALQTACMLNAKGMHAAAEQATDTAAQLIQHAKDTLLMLQQQLLSAQQQHQHQQRGDTNGTLGSAGTQCHHLPRVFAAEPAPPPALGYPPATAAGGAHLPAACFNTPASAARAAAAQMQAWAGPAWFAAADDTDGEPEVTSHWRPAKMA